MTDTDTITTGHTRATIDLQDRIDDIEQAIGGLELALDVLRGDATESDLPDGADPEELLADYDADPAEADVKDSIRRLKHSRDLLQADVQRFGGSEFTIKKFRAGETTRVNDLVLQDTLDSNSSDPRSKLNARKLRTIQIGVTETPPEAPDKPDAFETPTMEFLYQRIDNLNTYGEVTLEDF